LVVASHSIFPELGNAMGLRIIQVVHRLVYNPNDDDLPFGLYAINDEMFLHWKGLDAWQEFGAGAAQRWIGNRATKGPFDALQIV
jgi:hypothetical protein